MNGACIACAYIGVVDQAHIKSKGSGGTMDEWNLMPLCRKCHTNQHTIGWKRFSEKYPSVQQYLYHSGWGFHAEQGVWKLRRNLCS